MEAIVLAGGLGTRLRGVVDDVPKPMAPVQGRPFLALVLDQLADSGFRTAILATGYLHETIRAHFGEKFRDLALVYSVEHQPLGTGGAIRLACALTRAPEVFVLNGDTYLSLDFQAMLDAHVRAGARLTMAVCQVPDVARYGALEVAGGIVRGFREKGRSGPGLINGGTYVLGPALRDRLPAAAAFSFEQDLLVPEARSIQPVAFLAGGRFIDIGIPEDYVKAQTMFDQRQAHRVRS
jgi:D-glycero-alpha-D-manno-heptose 1-phosphate guanylyltransferase